ncbi:acyl-CoA thioesterase [Streptomyces calidiresistens]|uniref:Acyl-CoA thioesterase n=1 Tax=Streptomyces calidiresistens TaxID=1485586 RepID=A0A7W3T2F8_9ACTN|nr:thioesterase family protein [Streptomyces calidiresistens]MBB0229376.1 acyl-CoA thioesterase [Streptomyces calidiresistens]
MDSFGHINNVVFLRYLEEARIDFLWRLAREAAEETTVSDGDPGPGASGEGGTTPVAGRPGVFDPEVPFSGTTVVARHEIDYLRPLVHRHAPIDIELWVAKIGAAATTIAYEMIDGSAVHARARTVIVPYDLEKERPRRLSAVERSFLERYFDDATDNAAAVR